MVDISIIIPTLEPNPTFSWEEQLEASAVDGEVVLRDDPTASEARNAGIREASADKLVFLDDDSDPQPGYFERVSALLDDHPAVTGRIIDTGAQITRGLSGQYDQGDESHVTETVVGCNMAVRRSVLDDVGGFDPRLPYGHEEAELADRISDAYYVWYDPELVVAHPFADSLFDYFGKAYRHGREAIPYYLIRGENVHRRMLLHVLVPSHYIGDSPRATLFEATSQLASTAGLVRGYLKYARGDRAATYTRGREAVES
ncbi:glycosyltransferase family 2 protein [Halogeometricum limi]|uniref:Glycosyltransferase, GT2 family n=1 Tax=Halogeometricum limi TaxID=555875 RepID=A0A1I6IKN9_9EURY|nr:glycosyltransferase [Halogeometricum limi]SFR67234.1 Glycosyltransferase, GT2 family [Halogeometricum limi]